MAYSSIKGYKHTQSTPATVWTINHNLGTQAPIVDVFYNDGGQMTKVLPSNIQVVNSNTVTLTFSTPISGTAEVV
jgi:ribosomal protein L2